MLSAEDLEMINKAPALVDWTIEEGRERPLNTELRWVENYIVKKVAREAC